MKRGSALVGVIWTLAVLSILIASYAMDAHLQTRINLYLRERVHVDHLTDCVDNYLVQLSPHTNEEHFIRILTQYHKLISEFEHLGDDAVNIADAAKKKHDEKVEFTETALKELALTRLLLNNILEYAKTAFEKRDVDSA